MERDKALQLFTAPAYKAICVNVAGSDADDLHQELFLYIAGLPDDKLTEITSTCPACWYSRAATQQYRSNTSRFHATYRRDHTQAHTHEADIIQSLYEDDDTETVDQTLFAAAIDSLGWYEYHVLIYYAEYGSLRVLSQRTKIPVKTLHNTINNIKRTIKKFIYEHSDDRR